MEVKLWLKVVKVAMDQSALICMAGLTITMAFAIVSILLEHILQIRLLTILTVQLLGSALCPVYWIYMSDKLRAVTKKWMRIYG